MKIKINFLITILFLNIVIAGVDSQLKCFIDEKIVETTIEEIKNIGLFHSFKQAICQDVFEIYKRVQSLLSQMNQANYKSVYDIITNENLSEAISSYKNMQFYFAHAPSFLLISEETQVKIMTGFFFQFNALLNQKKELDKFFSNEQVNTLLFLLTAMGIQSIALGEFKKIVQIVNKNVINLANENLDDLVLQATTYEIFNILAEEIVKEKILNKAFNKISEDILDNKKKDIHNFKTKKNKMIKKNNK